MHMHKHMHMAMDMHAPWARLSVRPAELTTVALRPVSSGVTACCTQPITVARGSSGCHVNESKAGP